MFKIDVTDFEWINSAEDDPEDLCLHGKVTAHIGAERLEDYGTVSSTALYLLKTLTENHNFGGANLMVPCCAHFIAPGDPDWNTVITIGCDDGTDWSVEQALGGVKITTQSGAETFVPMAEYRAEVYRFADKVESYYSQCAPKKPNDDFSAKGYQAFWNEWHRRRDA